MLASRPLWFAADFSFQLSLSLLVTANLLGHQALLMVIRFYKLMFVRNLGVLLRNRNATDCKTCYTMIAKWQIVRRIWDQMCDKRRSALLPADQRTLIQWRTFIVCRRYIAYMASKQPWNNCERLKQNCFICFISVLFQFHFTCASRLRSLLLFRRHHITPTTNRPRCNPGQRRNLWPILLVVQCAGERRIFRTSRSLHLASVCRTVLLFSRFSRGRRRFQTWIYWIWRVQLNM